MAKAAVAQLMGEADLPGGGVAALGAVEIGDPDLRPMAGQHLLGHDAAATGSDDVDAHGRVLEHPLPVVAPRHAGRGLVRADQPRRAQPGEDARHLVVEAGLGAQEQVGQRALADGEAEQMAQQRRQPLVADGVGVTQIDRQRRDRAAERRAGLEPGRRRRHEAARAARTAAAVQRHPRHHRAHRRQLDLVIDLDRPLIGRAQRRRAMRALLRPRLDLLVRVVVQPPPAPGPAHARLAPQAARPFRLVRLAIARGRQARIARSLRRLREPRLQLSHPLLQRLDLARLRQDDLDQLVFRMLGQRIAIHPKLESRRESRVNILRAATGLSNYN